MRARASRLIACVALVAAALLVVGCHAGDESDESAPRAESALPALVLRDDTPALLLTWVDERGATHVAEQIAAVPANGRAMVRVVTTAPRRGDGALFYVADLRTRDADGAYPVHTVTRNEWEAAISKRRNAYLARQSPDDPEVDPDAPPRTAPPLSDPRALSGLTAVVYGASWCKPCHDAADFLNRRGVHVVQKDIEEDASARAEMSAKLARAGMPGGGIPVLDVGGVLLQGFNPNAVDRAIHKALAGTAL